MPTGIYIRTKKFTDTYRKNMSLALIGKKSWNKNLTKETDLRIMKASEKTSKAIKELWNNTEYRNKSIKSKKGILRILREIRVCQCGCEQNFECKENSKQRFIHGHYIKIRSLQRKNKTYEEIYGKDRVDIIKSKITGRRPNKREIRICKCGCGKSKEVMLHSLWKYFRNHHSKNNKGKNIEQIYGIEKAQEIRKKFSTRMKLQYSSFTDYEKRDFLKNSFFKAGKHPNKFELTCKKLLDIHYPNEFDYCGNGTKVINGKNPDFIHKTKKIAVLCHGVYWHLSKYNIQDTKENRLAVELNDSQPFRANGYEVWIIWEDRLSLNKVVIINKEEVKQNVEEVYVGN